jgi:WD40 repeat protein
LLSSTAAHSDFVKTLFLFPSLKLLVSGGSDKIIRLWFVSLCYACFFVPESSTFNRDVSMPTSEKSLVSVGTISSHTRPIECLDGQAQSDRSAILYTADTMGVIKIWELEKEGSSPSSRWRSTLIKELNHPRTRINEMVVGNGHIWTGLLLRHLVESVFCL